MTLFQALVLFGDKTEDRSEVTFIRARVLSDAPKDTDGQPVKNPAGINIYGAKGFSAGDCEHVVLLSRGIGGLYDLIPQDKVETVLAKMKKKIEQLPEVPLVESEASLMDRKEARKRAADHQRSKRQARQSAGAIDTSLATTTSEQPE